MHAVYAQTQHVPGLFMLLMYRNNTVCLNIVTNTMYLNFISILFPVVLHPALPDES